MLCLAVVLATVAAFGLHPEPVDEARNAGVQVSQTESVRSGAHLCVACLTHATSLAAPFAAVLLAPPTSPTRRCSRPSRRRLDSPDSLLGPLPSLAS
jgi:hypothetical protein